MALVSSILWTDLVELEDGSILLLIAANMAALTNNPAFQNLDYTLVKFMPGDIPEVQFARCYGGEFADIPHSLQTTTDGGFIISGYSNSEHAFKCSSIALTYLVKLDQDFETTWNSE